MRKKSANSRDQFSKVTSPRPEDSSPILYQDFKNLFIEILRCTDPMDFAKQSTGQSYIYAQAMLKENPDFFYALSGTVMKQYMFELRINEKMTATEGDDPEIMRDKRRLQKPLKNITFEELCDSDKFAMRGRTRELMNSLRDAMNYAGPSLSDMDKQKVLNFIHSVDRLCVPLAFAPGQPSRIPA